MGSPALLIWSKFPLLINFSRAQGSLLHLPVSHAGFIGEVALSLCLCGGTQITWAAQTAFLTVSRVLVGFLLSGAFLFFFILF